MKKTAVYKVKRSFCEKLAALLNHGAIPIMDTYDIDLSEEMTEAELETAQEAEKMKTLWYIEQDPEKKVIEIRPGINSCISLHGAQEARHFIEVLEEAIQETF